MVLTNQIIGKMYPWNAYSYKLGATLIWWIFVIFIGILYLFGMILYPAGWGAERVQRICGPEADAFYLANCSLGKSKTTRCLILKIKF